MRTTLDIDDDVLQAAKEIGRARKQTAGQVISEIVRGSLNRGLDPAIKLVPGPGGFPMLPPTSRVITNEIIDRIKDEIELEEVEAANALRRQRPAGADR